MGIEVMHVNVLNIRAQKMPVFSSPLGVEAEASFAGFEFPPSTSLLGKFPQFFRRCNDSHVYKEQFDLIFSWAEPVPGKKHAA